MHICNASIIWFQPQNEKRRGQITTNHTNKNTRIMNNVKVTAKDGQVVVQSTNNPEFGYIRVQQTVTSFEDGWANVGNRSAIIRGRVENLKQLNYKEGQTLPGKIHVVESTTAPYDGADPKINPSTGEILTSNGQPIYREAYYTQNLQKTDQLIEHDSVTQENPQNAEEFEPSISQEG